MYAHELFHRDRPQDLHLIRCRFFKRKHMAGRLQRGTDHDKDASQPNATTPFEALHKSCTNLSRHSQPAAESMYLQNCDEEEESQPQAFEAMFEAASDTPRVVVVGTSLVEKSPCQKKHVRSAIVSSIKSKLHQCLLSLLAANRQTNSTIYCITTNTLLSFSLRPISITTFSAGDGWTEAHIAASVTRAHAH